MGKVYITLVGARHYYGIEAFKIGMKVHLVKNEKNESDAEAIEVYGGPNYQIGNVANSVFTVARGTHSAGYVHHYFDTETDATVRFIVDEYVIAEMETEE